MRNKFSATFAPAIGPTIGGYLTENYGWKHIFYVNLVPGSLMLVMLWSSLEPAPMRLSLLNGRLSLHLSTTADIQPSKFTRTSSRLISLSISWRPP